MDSSLSIEFISFCPVCGSQDIEFKNAVLSPFFAARALDLDPVVILDGEFRDLKGGTSYQPCKSIYCAQCLSVSCNARLSAGALQRYYQGYLDEKFIDMRSVYEPSSAVRISNRTNPNTLRAKGEPITYLNNVEDYYLSVTEGAVPSKILDYGGGTGVNSPFQKNSDVTIVDIDNSSNQAISPALTASSNYDLICLMNVLEHVISPVEILRSAISHSTSPCNVLIEVPLERFMHKTNNASTYKSKKIWTEHINCFSPIGLMRLVEASGLKPLTPNCTTLQTSLPSSNNVCENHLTLLIVCSTS